MFERAAFKAVIDERFREIMELHGPALGRLAGSYTRTPGDRDDLFQEIALAIWQALPRFRGECSERTFVFRIAHNRAIAHIAQRRPPNVNADEAELHDPRPTPERGLSDLQQQVQLQEAIDRLPLAYRQVITLTLEDMSYTEIAEVLGISESNVGARLTRGRQMLKQILEKTK